MGTTSRSGRVWERGASIPGSTRASRKHRTEREIERGRVSDPDRVRPGSVTRTAPGASPERRPYIAVTSMKLILLLLAPGALLIVSRPSVTSTVTAPSNQRVALVGVALIASTPSTRSR